MIATQKAAHEYLDLGFSVIPIGEDKIPCIEWKQFQEYLPTHDMITHWWDRYRYANVGIVTGVVSGVLVMDLDSNRAQDYARQMGTPETPIALTSKGAHVYFDFPSNLVGNKSDQKLGMDIRGEGGYVVSPPSIHQSGIKYKWTRWHPWNTRIAKMPRWLFDWCNELDRGNERQKGWQYEVLQGVRDGGRNNAAASLAGRFFNKDLSVPEIIEILLMWNERNDPPLPEDEIVRTVTSMGARHERNR